MAGISNGSRLPKRKRSQALELLGAGYSVSEVSRKVGITRNTVAGFRDTQLSVIEQANERIASQCRRIASKAFDQLDDALSSGKPLKPRELVPVAGMCVDKLILFSRGSSLPDLHQHLHQHLHITAEQAKDAAAELIKMRQLPNESPNK